MKPTLVSISRPQESSRWEMATLLLSFIQNRTTGTKFIDFIKFEEMDMDFHPLLILLPYMKFVIPLFFLLKTAF